MSKARNVWSFVREMVVEWLGPADDVDAAGVNPGRPPSDEASPREEGLDGRPSELHTVQVKLMIFDDQ